MWRIMCSTCINTCTYIQIHITYVFRLISFQRIIKSYKESYALTKRWVIFYLVYIHTYEWMYVYIHTYKHNIYVCIYTVHIYECIHIYVCKCIQYMHTIHKYSTYTIYMRDGVCHRWRVTTRCPCWQLSTTTPSSQRRPHPLSKQP